MLQRPRKVASVLAALAVALTSCAAANEESPTTPSSQASTPPSSETVVTKPDSSSGVDGPAVFTPVTGSVVAAPIPVAGTDGKDHLVYELALTNTLAQEVTLTSLSVRSGDETLLSLTGDALAYWTRAQGVPVSTPTRTLGPGQSGTVWLDVALDRPAGNQPSGMPTRLVHALGISVRDAQPPLVPQSMTETIAATEVQNRQAVSISPPLHGPKWLDGDGCCAMSAHRMALNPINGSIWAAERFAIDYVQLNEQNRLFEGPQDKVESYAYFGADIHAVADGPVVAVVDDLPEAVPGQNPTGLTLEQYGGNHVVQDIGNGNYAFYAHLRPGSLKVQPGDQLAAGQVIASLGNSGNSDAPHLHFHVMDGPDPLRSNGLPFVFDAFRLASRLASEDALDPILTGAPAELEPGFAGRDVTDSMPLDLDVVDYPSS